MPTVRENSVLPPVGTGHDREPRRKLLQHNVIRIGAIGRNDHHIERARIEIGTPNNTRLGGVASRLLSESEGPIAKDRDRCRIHRASRRSREHAKRYSPDRGAAIPT